MKHKKKYKYPWRTNNQFQTLIDGEEYFSSMLEAIQHAKTHILFEIYLFESGKIASQFITALSEAKNRGVNVYLFLDSYGAQKLNETDRKKITATGIEFLLYNPVNLFHIGKSLKRDHRKLLIIDRDIAFIGGAGITDEFSPATSFAYWHDVMLKIEGHIVDDFIHSFTQIWNQQKSITLDLLPDYQQSGIPLTHIDSKAHVLIGEGAEHNEINRAIVAHISSSKHRVWLTSPYFISSWKIRRALHYAAKKGRDVRLIFPGPHSDHKWITYGIHRYYSRFLKANIAIYEYQPRFTHSKIILCDDWFTIGSSNLDRWNQYLNLDTNIEVYDKKTHQQIIELFELDFSTSKLITSEQWYARSLAQRIKEWSAGLLISWLSFISRKYRR